MDATDAAELADRFFLLAMKVANQWASRWPYLADEFTSTAGHELWRFALAFEPDPPWGMASFASPLRRALHWRLCSVVRDRSTGQRLIASHSDMGYTSLPAAG